RPPWRDRVVLEAEGEGRYLEPPVAGPVTEVPGPPAPPGPLERDAPREVLAEPEPSCREVPQGARQHRHQRIPEPDQRHAQPPWPVPEVTRLRREGHCRIQPDRVGRKPECLAAEAVPDQADSCLGMRLAGPAEESSEVLLAPGPEGGSEAAERRG